MNRENKETVQRIKNRKANEEIKKAYDDAVKQGKFKGTEDDFREKIDMMRDDIDDNFAKGGRAGYFNRVLVL